MLRSAREVCLSTGPILRRELLGLLRSRRAFWIAVLTVGASSLIPLLHWPEDGEPAPHVVAHSAFDTYRSPLAWVPLLLYFPALAAAALAASTAGILASTIAGTAPRAVVIAYLICVGELIAPSLRTGTGSHLSVVLSPPEAFFDACQGIMTEREWRVLPSYLLSLALSLGAAAIKFGLAVVIYKRRWLRDR